MDQLFRERWKACHGSTKDIEDDAVSLIWHQYFKKEMNFDIPIDTYRKLIACKMAADTARKLNQEVPPEALLLLQLAGEREYV